MPAAAAGAGAGGDGRALARGGAAEAPCRRRCCWQIGRLLRRRPLRPPPRASHQTKAQVSRSGCLVDAIAMAAAAAAAAIALLRCCRPAGQTATSLVLLQCARAVDCGLRAGANRMHGLLGCVGLCRAVGLLGAGWTTRWEGGGFRFPVT